MADTGLLGLLTGGGGNIGGVDLNQLVRPPDPLGAALAEMSQRFATAGQASRLPVSTLGAIGSALGGAGAAAQTQQTQYLDQAIKLQALKRSLQQMGITDKAMNYVLQQWAQQQAGGGAAPGAPLGTPGNPLAGGGQSTVPAGAPAAAPGAGGPFAAGGPFDVPDYSKAFGPTAAPVTPDGGYNPMLGNPSGPSTGAPPAEPDYIIDDNGNRVINPSSSRQNMTGLLGNGGGVGAAISPNLFRLASLADPAGAGAGADLIAVKDPRGLGANAAGIYPGFAPRTMTPGTDEVIPAPGQERGGPQYIRMPSVQTGSKWRSWESDRLGRTVADVTTGAASDLVTGGALPAALRGLLASNDSGSDDPLTGLLGKSPDEVIPSSAPREDVQLASMTAPRSKENIVASESGGNPNIGYGGTDLSNAPRDPETGFPQWAGRQGPAGISHAAGKYQFEPATWAEGARALGINDFSEKSQDAVYDWTRAKYGDAPWRASEGGGLPIVKAQYAPGSGAPAGAPVQGGFPKLVGPGSGMIPGLGMTPAQVALLNTMFTLGGTNSPLKEFLDVYYKSPEYLRGAAQATQEGQTAVTGPAQIAIDQAKAMNDINVGMAKDGVMIDPEGSGKVVPIPGYGPAMSYNADQLAAVKNKWEIRIEEAKAKLEWDKPQTMTYIAPNGQSRTITVTPRMLAGGQPPQAVSGPNATGGGGVSSGAVTSDKGGGLLAPSAAAPAAGTVPPGGLLTGLAPGAAEEQKGQGQQLSTFVTKVHGDAETARTQAPDLEMLARVGPNIDWAGPGAPYKQIFNRATASAFGVNTENVASYEMAQQLMGGMLRKALRASDSNPTEKQQQMMLATFPTPESSKQGFAQGVGYMQGIGDWQVFREEALRNWTQTHNNSADGFQENFKISAIPFVVQQMPQATRDAYFAQLKAADPSGKALHRLADQMQAVKQGNYNYSY